MVTTRPTAPAPPAPRRPAVRRGVVVLVAAGAALAACAPSATDAPRPERSVGEALGARIEDYFGRVPALDRDVRAVLVTVDDETVLETYRQTTADEHRHVASVTKTVLGTLVGIAIGEGLLEVDAPLSDLLPQHAPSMSPDVAATTVRDLLTMTSPFRSTAFTPWEPQGPDWVADAISTADRAPGRFAYSDPGTHVLAAVLAQATGTSVLEYGRRRLFEPLGIDTSPAAEMVALPENVPAYEDAGFAWPVDPTGQHVGFSLLKLRPDDMLRIGTVYLHDGRWEGRQVVPAEWVRDATTQQVPVGGSGAGDGYGYLWWVEETASGYDTHLAWGYGGQLIHVVPELGLVTVVSTERDFDTESTVEPVLLVFNMVNQMVIPAAERLHDADG